MQFGVKEIRGRDFEDNFTDAGQREHGADEAGR